MKMEAMQSAAFGVCVCCVIYLMICGWKVVNWAWLRPRKIEKLLRKQGFKGNSYRLLYGDLKELPLMIEEATSTPIHFSDDIIPRVAPGFHKSVTTYGKKSFRWIGPNPEVLITDTELIKEILSKHFDYQKPRGNPLTKLLANGIIFHEGQKWAKHRKIINPAFHVEKLKHILPAIELSCSEMVCEWEEMASSSSSSSCEMDVFSYLRAFTSDVISRTAFGSNYKEGRKIFELQKEQAELIMQASSQIYIPGYWFLPTKTNKRMKAIAKEVNTLVRGIINKRTKVIEAGEASADDLLGILLDSNYKEMKQQGNKDLGMSIDDVIEECKVFYFAGQETTSVFLAWTMILLARHQDWQARAREEIFQVFGHNKPDFEGLNRLKIGTMIFHEVLRLYTPAIELTRMIHEEMELGGEILLPAGTQLTLPILMLHRDKEIWGSDAGDFKPERFSEGIAKATKGKVCYFPFGWGPRICIGQNFSMVEAKLTLSMILQRFSFELSPSYTHAPCDVISLQPQHGAHLILKKLH